jgi:hypothetical protein
MVQTYQLPVGTDKQHVALKQHIVNCLEALRSHFSGSAEPSSPVAYQSWADTSTGFLKIRNAANNAWINLAPLAASVGLYVPQSEFKVASLSATTTLKLGAAKYAGNVKRLVLLGETASTSSSGNEWRPMLRKRTNATPGTPVDLFSATVGTFTALGGVGGGVEFVAFKVLTFTPNQNATVALDDVLELVLTKAGTATTLVNFSAWVELE